MNTTPQRLGKYELQYPLGRGSVGEVWKGHDPSAHRDVAIKLLHADLQQSDPNFMTRFITEGQSIVSLRHDNIAQVYDVDIARSAQSNETVAYIASEFIEGQTLADYLKSTSHQGNIPSVAEIVYLFTSLGVAIDHAHQCGVIHGDIKPSNILLNKHNTAKFASGEPMLTDFGLTQILESDHSNGSAASIANPFYMSPEQARGLPANNRSDIYSLGVLLYEVCTGVLPFRDESSVAVMMQHIDRLPTPPILINPNIPPALSEVILRAMAKNTATRFSLASLLATSIAEACAMQTTIQITRSSTSEEEDSLYQTSNDAGASILGVAQPSVSQPLHSHSQSMPRIPSQPLRSPSQPIPRIPSQPLRSPSQPIPRIPSQPLQSPSQPIPRLTPTTPAAATQPMHKITSQPLPTAGVTPPSINSGPMPSVRPMPTTTSAATRPNLPRVSGPLQVPTASSMPTAPFSIPASQAQQKSVSAPLPIPKLPRSVSRLRTLNFTDTPVYVVIGALVVLLIVLGTAIGASLALNKGQTASSNSLGHVFFQDDALGHADQLRIELLNPPAQPGGKSYFAWLQDTNQHTQPLGQLTINNGTASLLYQGDSKHTNLLSITQGILITVEDSGSQPQAPNGNKVFQTSFDTATLQALKDILYQTPDFPGNQGVAAGMVDTIKSMNDKAQSIVDSLNGHDYTLVTRQATRIIEMIDGTKYATSNGDLPAKYPRLLFTNAGLISSSTQTGYIDTLDKQLDNIKQVAGNNATLLQHIQNVKNAIADLRDWIQKIRTYDVQILKAADLKSPAILGTALQLSKAAADSYTGRTIPPNQGPTLNAGSAGAYQAYTECQYLATLDIQAA